MLKEKKNQIVFGIVAVCLMGASFYVGSLTTELKMLRAGNRVVNSPTENAPPSDPSKLTGPIEPVSSDDHIFGNPDAKIALIEYSDFECPYCQSFHVTAKELVEQYDGDVMWVYRHFPLDSIHPNARPAAEASECIAQLAGNDAFWAFTDSIFAKASLSDEVIIEVANSLGADITACLASGEVTQLVDDDLNSGLSAGIKGTPGNVILNVDTEETVFVPGALPLPQLSEAVDSLL